MKLPHATISLSVIATIVVGIGLLAVPMTAKTAPLSRGTSDCTVTGTFGSSTGSRTFELPEFERLPAMRLKYADGLGIPHLSFTNDLSQEQIEFDDLRAPTQFCLLMRITDESLSSGQTLEQYVDAQLDKSDTRQIKREFIIDRRYGFQQAVWQNAPRVDYYVMNDDGSVIHFWFLRRGPVGTPKQMNAFWGSTEIIIQSIVIEKFPVT